MNGTAHLTVEIDTINGYGSTAEFTIDYTISKFYPRCHYHDDEGGELEGYTIRLDLLHVDGWETCSIDAAKNIVHWLAHNRDKEIMDAIDNGKLDDPPQRSSAISQHFKPRAFDNTFQKFIKDRF